MLTEIIKKFIDMGASDIHIKEDSYIYYRQNGLFCSTDIFVSSFIVDEFKIKFLSEKDIKILYKQKNLDKALNIEGKRIRTNINFSMGKITISLRLIEDKIIGIDSLGIKEFIDDIINHVDKLYGFVLITGRTGSGKTTTLNSIIDYINSNYNYNIVTFEDPVEYVHVSNKSLINQRELGKDILTYNQGIFSALRQDVDIIIISEIRRPETIQAALTAAETGHLVISTIHTFGLAKTIDRIVDVFPNHIKNQIRFQLAITLRAIISQKLVLEKDKRRAEFKLLRVNKAVENLIRENKIYQIENFGKIYSV